MKLRIVAAVLLVAAITGCKSRAAFDYSEKIVKMEKDLGPEIEKTDEQMAKFIEDQNYDSVVVVSTHMEELVDNKLSEIKKMDAPSVAQADNFKQASIRYFSFMKNMYTAYKSFASQKTEEEREAERVKLVDLNSKIVGAIKEMQKAQKEYADANNFKIKSD